MSTYSDCEKEALVHQLVRVDARVTVKPILNHGEPSVSCVSSEVRSGGGCDDGRYDRVEGCSDRCTFYVTQIMCVEIPIRFGVEVDIDNNRIRCGTPEFGPCNCKFEDNPQENAPSVKFENCTPKNDDYHEIRRDKWKR